jgi:hypothetical protein
MTGVPVGDLPETLTTARLRLPLISPEDAAGMLAGRRRESWHRDYPTPRDQDAVAMVKADDPAASWGPRHVVRSGDGTTIGSVGFYGAPGAGDDEVPEAEVGFGLVADARGFGHGGFGHQGGFGHRGFGYGGFGHHRYFHHRGFRRRFGGFNWDYPAGRYFLSSDFGDCRFVYNPLFFGHERVCS